MKYSTNLIYGIPPKVLEDMPYRQALEECKAGAKLQILRFSKPPFRTWCGRRKVLVSYINKSIKWIDDKLGEMR